MIQSSNFLTDYLDSVFNHVKEYKALMKAC